MKLVKANNLTIVKPTHNEIQSLGGADKSMHMSRIGYVNLSINIHFPMKKGQYVCSFDKQFEIMNIEEDFILGAETFNVLFPNDHLNSIIASKSDITDYPSNVQWHDYTSANIAIIRDTTGSATDAIIDYDTISDEECNDEYDDININNSSASIATASSSSSSSSASSTTNNDA